jgi:DNA-binding NtrC family response regulator
VAHIDVLIVDDNSAVAESFGDILVGAGISVITATTLDEASETMAENQFGAVILDHHLAEAAEGDGAEGCPAGEALPPVILVSGMHAEELQRVQREYGQKLFAYLAKPVAPQTLIEVVRRALG